MAKKKPLKKPTTKGKKATPIAITRPTLEAFEAYVPSFKKSIDTGILTHNSTMQEFERGVAKYLGVAHCVAVSSCTAGLMLVLKGLNLSGEVIVPSFTFAASAHPLIWNNLKPVFADVHPATYTLDPESVEKHITKKTSAILATHVYGVPSDVEKLQKLARKHKLKLIFDAAHAFGATVGNKKVGNFGDVEVFSLSPIKVLTAAEGGIVATNDARLAEFVRLGRNYGDDGTNNTLFAGLSARMSELHAAIGLRSLKKLPTNLKNRQAKAQYLLNELKKIEPRLIFQQVPQGHTSTNYIFSIRVNPNELGYTRDELHDFLGTRNIKSRKYFYPPLHMQPTYKAFAPGPSSLPTTMEITQTVLALPMYSHISKEELNRVIEAFREFSAKKKYAGSI